MVTHQLGLGSGIFGKDMAEQKCLRLDPPKRFEIFEEFILWQLVGELSAIVADTLSPYNCLDLFDTLVVQRRDSYRKVANEDVAKTFISLGNNTAGEWLTVSTSGTDSNLYEHANLGHMTTCDDPFNESISRRKIAGFNIFKGNATILGIGHL